MLWGSPPRFPPWRSGPRFLLGDSSGSGLMLGISSLLGLLYLLCLLGLVFWLGPALPRPCLSWFSKNLFQNLKSKILPPSFLFHSLRNWICILVLFIPVPRFRTNFFGIVLGELDWCTSILHIHLLLQRRHDVRQTQATRSRTQQRTEQKHLRQNGLSQNGNLNKISFTSHWTWLIPNNGVWCVRAHLRHVLVMHRGNQWFLERLHNFQNPRRKSDNLS